MGYSFLPTIPCQTGFHGVFLLQLGATLTHKLQTQGLYEVMTSQYREAR